MFHQVHTVKLELSRAENKRLRFEFAVQDENCICNNISNKRSDTEVEWSLKRFFNCFEDNLRSVLTVMVKFKFEEKIQKKMISYFLQYFFFWNFFVPKHKLKGLLVDGLTHFAFDKEQSSWTHKQVKLNLPWI